MELERLQVVIEASTSKFKEKMNAIKNITKSATDQVNNMANTVDTKAIDKLNNKIDGTQSKLANMYAQMDAMKAKANADLSDMPYRSDADKDNAVESTLAKDKAYQKLKSTIQALESELEKYKVTLSETENLQSNGVKKANRFADAINKVKTKIRDVKSNTKSMNLGLRQTLEQSIPLTKSIFKLSNMLKLMAIRMVLRSALNATKAGFEDLAKANQKFNSTMSTSQSQLLQSRNALATAFAPALQALTPLIVTVTNAFINGCNVISMFTSRLFGNSATFIKASKVSTDYAKSLGGVGASAKKAQGSLAGFDEITNLSKKEDTSATTDTGMPAPTEMFQEEIIPTEKLEVIDKIKAKITELKDMLKGISFAELTTALDDVWNSATPLTQDIFVGLEWAYKNIFIPLAAWTIQDVLPAFLDLLSAALGVLHDIIIALKPYAEWMWDTFLKPFADFVGGIIIDFLKGLTQKLREFSDWARQNKDTVQLVSDIVLAFFAGLWIYYTTKNIIRFITDLGPKMVTLASKIGKLFTPTALAAFAIGVLAIGIIELAKNWDKLTPKQRTITILGSLAAALTAAAIAVALFHTAWSAGVLAAAIAGGIALIAGTVLFKNKNEASLDGPTNASYSDAVRFANMDFSKGYNLPAFANGGVLSSPTVGLLAEYPGASSNPEIIAPENKIRKIVREESESFDDSRIIYVLSEILDAIKEGKEIIMDGENLTRKITSKQDSNFRRAGKTLLNV